MFYTNHLRTIFTCSMFHHVTAAMNNFACFDHTDTNTTSSQCTNGLINGARAFSVEAMIHGYHEYEMHKTQGETLRCKREVAMHRVLQCS